MKTQSRNAALCLLALFVSISASGAPRVCRAEDAPASAGASSPDSRLPTPDSAHDSLAREFDLLPKLLAAGKGNASGGDPLKAISTRMTGVHHDLAEMKTDDPVQAKERQVVRSLDEMIASLERHCSGLGTGNNPNSGRRDSIIVKSAANIGDLHGVDAAGRQWSQLPPKVRKEILQSTTDGFPAGYESLLQSYYQQLAEEKSLDDKPAAAPDGKKGGTPADAKGSK